MGRRATTTGKFLKYGNVVLGEWKGAQRKPNNKGSSWTIGAQRLREIEKLIRFRHGRFVDTDDHEVYLIAAFNSLVTHETLRARRTGKTRDVNLRLLSWAATWTPFATDSVVEIHAQNALRKPSYFEADELAKLLAVRWFERSKLNLRTIGAIDLIRSEREKYSAQLKKQRDRERAASIRRQRGAMQRIEYEKNSIAESCRRLGISRTTYYRWKREGILKDKLLNLDIV